MTEGLSLASPTETEQISVSYAKTTVRDTLRIITPLLGIWKPFYDDRYCSTRDCIIYLGINPHRSRTRSLSSICRFSTSQSLDHQTIVYHHLSLWYRTCPVLHRSGGTGHSSWKPTGGTVRHPGITWTLGNTASFGSWLQLSHMGITTIAKKQRTQSSSCTHQWHGSSPRT